VERKLTPGELEVEAGSLFAGCATGALELLEVQVEGKKRMAARDFVHGYRPNPGETLGHVVAGA
jgi:methionyl-tRNA formyltransferase